MNSLTFDNVEEVVHITPVKNSQDTAANKIGLTEESIMNEDPHIATKTADPLKINEVVITMRGVTTHDYGYILKEAMRLSDKVTSYSE